jgi:NAD-dependent deacetylase
VVTQNVDGLHAEAARDVARPLGLSPAPALPLELHGSIWRVRCTRCGARREDHALVNATSTDTLPRCEACGALARPDVVWFGEMLDPAVLGEAQRLAETADVCLVIGTSGVVYPAAGLAGTTREAGGVVIEVNPDATPLTPLAAVSLRGSAVEVMRRLSPP